jgi:sporulation protein YqfC
MNRHWGGRVLQWLDLPPDVLLDIPRLETVGHLELRLTNHRGVMRYEPGLVVVRVPRGRIEVRGENFRLGSIDHDAIWLIGLIRTIQFHVAGS